MRFPPTIGVVGFDFGYKPAFSVAVVPGTRGKVLQQDPDDPPPPALLCHDGLGDLLNVAISGVQTCDDCYTISPSGSNQDVSFSFTGPNGTFVAVWNALDLAWEVVVGTVTVNFFSSGDGTCTDQFTTATGDLTLRLQCSGENLFTASISGSAVISMAVFDGGSGVTFGDPINNTIVLTDCGTGNTIGGYGGVITLSL